MYLLESTAILEAFQNGRIIPEGTRSILQCFGDMSDTFLLLQVFYSLKLIRKKEIIIKSSMSRRKKKSCRVFLLKCLIVHYLALSKMFHDLHKIGNRLYIFSHSLVVRILQYLVQVFCYEKCIYKTWYVRCPMCPTETNKPNSSF